MTIDTKLCSFTTADNEQLHGLLFRHPQQKSDLALLAVHGLAMNFYLPPLAPLGQGLAGSGYHCFVINTRGHDWIVRAGNLDSFGGATYENLEDCLLDIDGALEYLCAEGYRRFILIGHSLGCIKTLLYQGTRKRSEVIGVVSCSCPKQYYSARAIEQPGFKDLMSKAEQLLAQGKGEEFFWAAASGSTGMFTARTYVSKYGRHETNDVRKYVTTLDCPLLTIAGGVEARYFHDYAQDLCRTAGASGTYKLIAGSGHFYIGHEVELVETITKWLDQFPR